MCWGTFKKPKQKALRKTQRNEQSWGIFLGPLLTNKWAPLKKGTWSGRPMFRGSVSLCCANRDELK